MTDDLAGTVTCDVTTLAPLAVAQCAATDPYTVTQADFDAGVIHNTATAAGTVQPATPVTSNPDSTDTFTTEHDPIIAITKTATLNDTNGNNVGDVGETITYGFTVFNTGNVTLTDVGVTDAKAGPVTCTDTTLAPHTSTACTADNPYVIVQADVDTGSVDNTATAHGTPPTGGPVVSDPGIRQRADHPAGTGAEPDQGAHDGQRSQRQRHRRRGRHDPVHLRRHQQRHRDHDGHRRHRRQGRGSDLRRRHPRAQ